MLRTIGHFVWRIQIRCVVTPARFERATYGLGNRRSIHLSYGAGVRAKFYHRARGTRKVGEGAELFGQSGH